jgi:metallo-beta-lactamase family protein
MGDNIVIKKASKKERWRRIQDKKRDKERKEKRGGKSYLKEYKKLSTIDKLKFNLTRNIFSGAPPKTNIAGLNISFLGAARTVTGSKYLLESQKSKVLIDCGLFQGEKELRLRNWDDLPIHSKNIDAIILTHAHLDHTGYIPLLIKNGFKGKIYCTRATFDLAKLILPDSGFLQEEEARYAKKKGYSKHFNPKPLYTQKDAMQSFKNFQIVDFHKEIKIDDEFSFSLTKAGHILGASSVLVTANGKKILFSGDLGRNNSPVVTKPEPAPQADYVLCESTYGNRHHDANENAENFLEEIINKTSAKGGKIIIPAFAVGRTQKLLYYINNLKKAGRIPDITIFLDSPMSIKVTALVDDYVAENKMSRQEYQDIYRNVKFCVTRIQSKKIFSYPNPAIIISASGMAAGGRVLHHIANYAPMPNTTILLVGYQAAGTRGRDLQEGKKEVKIHGEQIPVRAKIETMSNMSDHGDVNELIDWIKTMPHKPKKVFVVHGENEQAESFAKTVREEIGCEAEVPDYLESDKI